MGLAAFNRVRRSAALAAVKQVEEKRIADEKANAERMKAEERVLQEREAAKAAEEAKKKEIQAEVERRMAEEKAAAEKTDLTKPPTKLTKKDLEDYAMKKFGVNLDLRHSLGDLAAEVKALEEKAAEASK